jgi:hypothetical protein
VINSHQEALQALSEGRECLQLLYISYFFIY